MLRVEVLMTLIQISKKKSVFFHGFYTSTLASKLSTDSTNQVQIKPSEITQTCQNSDDNSPNEMKMSIKIIKNSLYVPSFKWSILYMTSSWVDCVCEKECDVFKGGKEGLGWSGGVGFPSHHFSLPGINHPHPIMIKSVAQITWFYHGAGERSFLQTSSTVNKSEISFGLQRAMSF